MFRALWHGANIVVLTVLSQIGGLGWLAANLPDIGKDFIEPHLAKRLGATTSKIRFQGCKAARHDDHIHVQL